MADEFDEVPWTREKDVVVVGGGGAGMTAAISAADADPNADVLLIQKLGELGGATTMSMGAVAAADTVIQDDANVRDSPELHFADFDKFVDLYSEGSGTYFYLDFEGELGEKDNLALRELLVEEAGKTIEWLQSLGCEFAGPYSEGLHSKPRLYQIVPNSQVYADVFREALSDRGIELLFDTEVYELVTDGSAVTGVLAAESGQRNPSMIEARDAVVLATGDYISNDELRERFTTDATASPINEFSTGDGHRMARTVGAELRNMDVQWLMFRVGDPYYVSPEFPRLVRDGALLLNKEGARFVNELSDYDQVFRATLHEPGEFMYLLFDDATAQNYTEWPNHISTWGRNGKVAAYLQEYRETELLRKADTIEGIAETPGMSPETLRTTVEAYNSGISDDYSGQSLDRYGRSEHRIPIDSPPYYLLGPIHTYSVLTDGGIAVNTDMEVLDTEGQPIENLYAAGAVAGDVHLFGHGHHHSWMFTSGRVAGTAAATDGV